jgi:hypothetical protein
VKPMTQYWIYKKIAGSPLGEAWDGPWSREKARTRFKSLYRNVKGRQDFQIVKVTEEIVR